MGKLAVGQPDRADFIQSGALAAVGQSAWFGLRGVANLALAGDFVGEVVIERSFDGGATALACTALGQTVVFTAPATEVLEEVEHGVLYRVRLRARTSGTLNWRVSR